MDKFELLKILLGKDALNEEEKNEIKKLLELVEEQKVEILGLEEQLQDAFFEGPHYKAKPKRTFELN